MKLCETENFPFIVKKSLKTSTEPPFPTLKYIEGLFHHAQSASDVMEFCITKTDLQFMKLCETENFSILQKKSLKSYPRTPFSFPKYMGGLFSDALSERMMPFSHAPEADTRPVKIATCAVKIAAVRQGELACFQSVSCRKAGSVMKVLQFYKQYGIISQHKEVLLWFIRK